VTAFPLMIPASVDGVAAARQTVLQRSVVAAKHQHGVALLAVLFALTLLAVLALPFSVSMSVGADAATRDVERAQTEQASASVRDLLLADAALSHAAFDPTPTHDGLEEWPDQVLLPAAFQPLLEDGKVLVGGSVWDLQRLFALDSVSPLVLTNLLGSTTRLAAELTPDAGVMALEDTSNLPDSGLVWLNHEVIRYAGKDGNTLVGLGRAALPELGFVQPEGIHAEASLVLDFRAVMAAAWPFLGRGNALRSERRPYATIGELNEMQAAGIDGFRSSEFDVLTAALSVDTQSLRAATWGRGERVFNDLRAGDRMLRVKSALHVGAGSTVRLRNQATGAVEYGLVMTATNEQVAIDLHLPSVFRLELLLPVVQEFPADNTIVEPLVPAPVNLNTASREVLVALFAEVRRAPNVRMQDATGRQRQTPSRAISRSEAAALADEILARRTPDGSAAGPFTGWQDFCERLLRSRLEAANDAQRLVWLHLYRNLQTGRDAANEFGTAPIAFDSGPWVGYRAAASRSRSAVAPGVAARHERTGIALATPGLPLEHRWETQQHFEEAFLLDRQAPFYTTTPINLGALPIDQRGGGEAGNDPASRYFPHLVPMAYPTMGFGAPRFPTNDTADASFTAANATTVRRAWQQGDLVRHETFAQAVDPRGRDLRREGAYLIDNAGPRGGGGGAVRPNFVNGVAAQGGGGRHDRISVPFSNEQGFMLRLAMGAWFEPQSMAPAVWFDHGTGDDQRNRYSLQVRDSNLVFEVLDEAGLDPDPGQSPAGVPRTAATWEVPLADLSLPPNTPVHVAVSAHGSRPSELAVTVDGMPRGRSRHMTWLTAAIPVFDPRQGSNQVFPPVAGNERFLDLQVESTEGFPPVGILRIGTELFEYSSINGNSFRCQWNDSLGGRAARQAAAEMRPNIPTDQNGQPTVDIAQLQQQGINLDVFPAHPAGSLVELYGYSTLLSEDSPMMVGSTQLAGPLGGFAVARGVVQNARPIALVVPGLPPINIGEGIDVNWNGELLLADPVPTRNYPPAEARPEVSEAFAPGGGYALLIQMSFNFEPPLGAVAPPVLTGGIEVIRYGARQGNRLTGVQRNQQLPGDNARINPTEYDGTARQFVTNWRPMPWDPANNQVLYSDVPTAILWVVPISIAVQNAATLWDPTATGMLEWVQILPRGNDVDTEWVRYDAIVDRQHLVRSNRLAWDQCRFALTNAINTQRVQMGQLGSNTAPQSPATPPWAAVPATSGFIGYTPQLESDFPQIHAARTRLRFRGDPWTRTSSHPQPNATVMQCQRIQLSWGNFGSFTGRIGRHDRVALVQGSVASGTTRPAVEWHTCNWVTRRFEADNLSQDRAPAERYGPWPFQLVGFREAVRGVYLGPPRGTPVFDPRQFDRVVKYPSGELPAAYCENPSVGSGVGNQMPMQGFVDEIDVALHLVPDLVVDEAFTAGASTFRTVPGLTYSPAGPLGFTNDLSATYPAGGGLLLIDGEILAYQQRANGEFTLAGNGRGLLGTQARDHDRGARVHFLTHRPAAVLSAGVGLRDAVLRVQALGAMPRSGTALLGTELLHYAWTRQVGDQGTLEMPRWFPAGDRGNTSQARGLLRARFGTMPATGGASDVVISWPFRFWDRYAEFADDPELAYFQLTTTEAPSFYRSLQWRQQTQDLRVEVVCLARTDSKAPWHQDPATTPGLWRFQNLGQDQRPHALMVQAGRLELRFATIYRPGVFDLFTGRAHGWKTTARIDRVRVDYEGQGRILDERITAQGNR
jgi:hypothetical protein